MLPPALFAQDDAAQRVNALATEYWEWRMREYPDLATWLGDTRYNDRLPDLSPAAFERRKAFVRDLLQRVRAIDDTRLRGQEALSHALLVRELQLLVDGQRFPTELLVLDQLDGPHLAFPQLVAATSFRNADDYRALVRRLHAFGPYLEQVTALLLRGIQQHWVQPAGPLRGVIAQIEGQLVADATQSSLYAPFADFPASVSDAERTRLRAEGAEAIRNVVLPALARFRDFARDVYLPAGRADIAIASVPSGVDYYAFAIRRETTTSLSADSIHRIGLAEVARIRAEMEQIVRDVGFTGTFPDFLRHLRTDPQFYFTDPDDLLLAYRDAAKRADAELPRLFATLPRQPYGVKPFPDYEAPSQTTARYYPGAEDGTRAGMFMVNLYKLETRPKYEIEALTLHEAVPGHHLQVARGQELAALPAFRRNALYTAFVEGWGLYAEGLGAAMGFYADPYSKFGQLTYEMWRACRLVVDTGLHSKGWARQQAIDFMLANSAKSEHDITVEVDRYIVWPGQALAYKLGELKLKELRARAARELSTRFDIRRFHNAVLDNGPLPLDVLEQQIKAWIAAQQRTN